jgi:hypothetical protein
VLAPTALAVNLGSFTVVSRSDSFITDVLTKIACYEDICVMERILSLSKILSDLDYIHTTLYEGSMV